MALLTLLKVLDTLSRSAATAVMIPTAIKADHEGVFNSGGATLFDFSFATAD
jgi:hypothetical protein